MKVAVMTGLPAKRYMNVDACHDICFLMNNFALNIRRKAT